MIRASIVLLVLVVGCKREPVVEAPPISFRLASGKSRPLGATANDVVLAEVSGDGVLDAMGPIDDLGGITTVIGDGKGGFESPQIPGVRFPIRHELVAIDVDNDSDIDFVAAGHDSAEVAVVLAGLRGTAKTRMFAARTGDAKPHNHGLVVADFDSDGDVDVVTSDQDQGSVALLVGDGKGGFAIAEGSPWPVGASPYPPAVGDLDGDGDLDIASPLVEGAAIAVLLGDGNGAFAKGPGSSASLPARPFSIALGDVNGDAKLDAVVAHDDAEIVSVLVGDGTGGLERSSELDLGGRGFDVKLVDVDANGTLDLVCTSSPTGVALMQGDGRGGFTHAPGSPYAAGPEPAGVAIGDVDRDGDLDLVAVSGESGQLTTWLRE